MRVNNPWAGKKNNCDMSNSLVFKRFLSIETYRILKLYKPFLTSVAYRYIKIRLHMFSKVEGLRPSDFHRAFNELSRIQEKRQRNK